MSRERSDLTAREQAHARVALRFVKSRCGSWEQIAKLLHMTTKSLQNVSGGATVSASLAFRIARLAKVGVDDLIAGKYPPAGACPHCGHVRSAEDPASLLGGAPTAEGGEATNTA